MDVWTSGCFSSIRSCVRTKPLETSGFHSASRNPPCCAPRAACRFRSEGMRSPHPRKRSPRPNGGQTDEKKNFCPGRPATSSRSSGAPAGRSTSGRLRGRQEVHPVACADIVDAFIGVARIVASMSAGANACVGAGAEFRCRPARSWRGASMPERDCAHARTNAQTKTGGSPARRVSMQWLTAESRSSLPRCRRFGVGIRIEQFLELFPVVELDHEDPAVAVGVLRYGLGLSGSDSLTATTDAADRQYTSDAAFTDSTTQRRCWPGRCRRRSAVRRRQIADRPWAWSEMPTVTVPLSSTRAHSWDFRNNRSPGFLS